jgi:hypothetical protein
MEPGMIEHLSRPIKIHVCKDRTLSYRALDEPVFNGVALPVYSVATKEQAEALLTAVGCRQYEEHPQMPGRPWLKINLDLKRWLELDDLPLVTAKLDQIAKRLGL